MDVKKLWSDVKSYTDKNSPTILTGLGVAGVFVTGYMAYKAGPKAHDILQAYHEDKKIIRPDDKETKRAVLKETAKNLAPVVLPPILMAGVTSACIIGSNKISTKRMAVLSAAYTIADNKLKDYQQKMLETLGEQRTSKVKEAIAKDHLDKAELKEPANGVIISGKVPCLDNYSKQVFYSSAEEIQQVINKLSQEMLNSMAYGDESFVELGELYEALGLEQTPYSRDFGWVETDMINGSLPIYTTACLRDNRPYLVVEYDELSPRKEYIYRHMDR